jgi:hypothetical protein
VRACLIRRRKKEEGRRKKEEGRGKKEEGRRGNLITPFPSEEFVLNKPRRREEREEKKQKEVHIRVAPKGVSGLS